MIGNLFLKNAYYEYDIIYMSDKYQSSEGHNEHETYLQECVLKNPCEYGLFPLADKETRTPVRREPVNRVHGSYDSVESEMEKYGGKCWHCTLDCEYRPWPLLVPKQSSGREPEYKVKAVTCSFPCMIAYVHRIYKYNKQKKEKLVYFAKYLFVMRFNQNPRSVEGSPGPDELASYGGTLTNKQYSDLVQTLIKKNY